MPAPTTHQHRPRSRKRPARARILVVEDDPDALEMLSRLLREEGFAVATARDGVAALAEARRSLPDLVITDLSMQPMGGVELCKCMRQLSHADVPVVVMTAHSDMKSVIESMHVGAEDYLVKPLDFDALTLCIERVFARRKEKAEWQRFQRAVNEQLLLSSLREQQHAEAEALRTAQLEALLENVDEGVIIADTSRRVTLMNEAARTILGTQPHEVGTIDAFNALDGFDLEGRPLSPDRRPLERAVRGEKFTDYEILRRRPNGERRRIVSTGTNVRDGQGRVVLALLVFRDVTELRLLEQHREEYVALVSHDLRNPLSSILGFVSVLGASLAAQKNGPLAELAERAQRNAKRMTAMLEELTEATSLEAGGVTLRREPIDLEAVLRGIASGFEDRLARRITVGIEGSESFRVLGDATRLERVIANLLTNALKYSPDGAPVNVRLERRDGVVALSVTDRGIGIAPEHQRSLFDRFYRTTEGRRRAGGLGLGLYIARMIVEAHGGRIQVASEVGVGSTFTVTIPGV